MPARVRALHCRTREWPGPRYTGGVEERPATTSGDDARPAFDRQAWRARREAKRERQRVESVERAGAMHAARLAAAADRPSQVGPNRRHPDPSGTLFVGCSGWFYWHWRNTFYPAGTSTGAWFGHYAKHFNTVELNAPFYCWPKVSAVEGWNRQAGRRRFTYTVKVSELITHVKRFVGTAGLVQDFYHVADVLGPRMGCFLFQLPPSYHYSKARLNAIVRQLDPARRNVVEFRHKSWWNETVYDAFRKAGIIFCSCSGPKLPDELVKTADEIYVRFHGTTRWYRHDYSDDELAVWARRIAGCGATRVWAYFNNDRECYAIKNAKELTRQLKAKPGKKAKKTKAAAPVKAKARVKTEAPKPRRAKAAAGAGPGKGPAPRGASARR